MTRRFLLGLILTLAGASTAPAMPVLSVDFLNQDANHLNYAVSLVGAEDLATYNIELIVQAPGLIDESMVGAMIPPDRYVFPDSSNFFAAANLAGGEVRVTLTDFTDPGVTTVAGVNDRIAIISLAASALVGPPTFRFDADSLVLDTPAGLPIAGFDELKRSLIAVPEPSSFVLAFVGVVVLFGRRRRVRH